MTGSEFRAGARRIVVHLSVAAIIVAGVLLVLTVVMNGPCRLSDSQRASLCTGSLRAIELALTLYAADNNGGMPPVEGGGLVLLVEEGYLDGDRLLCPLAAEGRGDGGELPRTACSYEYSGLPFDELFEGMTPSRGPCPGSPQARENAVKPLVWDRLQNHRGIGQLPNCLYTDGTVRSFAWDTPEASGNGQAEPSR